jgi:hypothetical protein
LQAVRFPERDSSPLDQFSPLERDEDDGALLDFAAVPRSASRNMQAQIFGEDRLAVAGLAEHRARVAVAEQIVDQPGLRAGGRQVGK